MIWYSFPRCSMLLDKMILPHWLTLTFWFFCIILKLLHKFTTFYLPSFCCAFYWQLHWRLVCRQSMLSGASWQLILTFEIAVLAAGSVSLQWTKTWAQVCHADKLQAMSADMYMMWYCLVSRVKVVWAWRYGCNSLRFWLNSLLAYAILIV